MKTGTDSRTTPIFEQIDKTVADIHGWSPLDQLHSLFNLVFLTAGTPGDVVEIGSWSGRSASVLGLAANMVGNTRVHCIDLFPAREDWSQNPDGSYSFQVTLGDRVYKGYHEQTAWKEPFERDIATFYERHPSLLDAFNEVITRHGLDQVVRPYRGDSASFVAASQGSVRCRLAFIDGDHSYQAVSRDIRNVETLLVAGGWICFDDAFSHYEGVNRAIEEWIIGSGRYDPCQQMTRKFFVARRLPAGGTN
jgi:predicted O-methyltransferase YrrM